MRAAPVTDVTALLMDWQAGEPSALERLLPIVYGELQRIAAAYLQAEHRSHTLQPTALIHEAYLRLVNQKVPNFRSRQHFYGVAAHLMRQVLVDWARNKNAQKRSAGERVSLEDVVASAPERPHKIILLDEALSELARIDDRKCKVIEMRYFGGLTNEEIAETLGVSIPTVVRDRRFAEAWLRQHLENGL
jgi:RNA polymerase sigma-70 factor, ECF subfamily